ncbi:glutathione S-transferase family protein [Pokkaliibacter sp. MBI-7]|uniref:glutathione S-transferase family protein n=1 Tax=Pokkaliibacter sp. MBI-7 TaxID=3040600 RepID=UPI00244C9517|nr:glutathione S-transferase family protein [Pokkaliibacter sp. MBI-7]MDH2435383.1 glutathione S-transferase family protein [Pokkaliibacter sp. MBI-7]
MITLYGSLHSRANRCAWMLKELNVDFHHEPTNFLDGSTHNPEFLQLNPNGRVPALTDDSLKLFESLAINLYLAKKFGGPLSPADMEEDALMTQWTLWAVTEIEKPLLLAAANNVLFDESSRSQDEFAIALQKLSRPWGVLDKHLSQHSHIVGNRFSVADLNVASVMTLVPIAAIDLSPWPALDKWLKVSLERPAASDWKHVSFRIPRPVSQLGMLAMFV